MRIDPTKGVKQIETNFRGLAGTLAFQGGE